MRIRLKESSMYEPIRQLLNGLGFIVRGEVNNCDIAAIKAEELWIVEMKLSANLTLLYQAMERKAVTEHVFIAINRPKNNRNKNFAALKKILSKLELGLILVSLDSPMPHAEIIIQPSGSKKAKTKKTDYIRNEILGRSSDSIGGTAKTKISTAYREKCIEIACLLEAYGEMNSRDLHKLGCEKDTASVLRNNYYGWFAKFDNRRYILSEAGNEYLHTNADTPLVAFYREKSNQPFEQQDLFEDSSNR